MNQDYNPFVTDELLKMEEQQKLMWQRVDNLIHRVFEQNDNGKELLEMWTKTLIMQPTVTPHSTQFQAGIEEGKKEFIRMINLTIDSIEGKVNES